MSTDIIINEAQKNVLKDIVGLGEKVNLAETHFDGRTIRALTLRNLVKITESKKGTFVVATSNGRKILN